MTDKTRMVVYSATAPGAGAIDRREALKRIGLGAAVIAGLPMMLGMPAQARLLRVNPRNATGDAPFKDPNNAAKIGVAGGIAIGTAVAGACVTAGLITASIATPIGAIIAAVGGIALLMISLFWPDSSTPPLTVEDVWNAIKGRVQAMIDQSLQKAFIDYYEANLTADLQGFGCTIKEYHSLKAARNPRYLDTFESFHNACNRAFSRFQGRGSNGNSSIAGWIVLPQYVQLVNNYIMLTFDVITPLPDIDDPKKPGKGDPVLTGLQLHRLRGLLDDGTGGGCIAYAENALNEAYQHFEKTYQDARGTINRNASVGYSASSWTADGAWNGKRDSNDHHNQYVMMVEDYLHWWKALRDYLKQAKLTKWIDDQYNSPLTAIPYLEKGDFAALAPVTLDRELWYGPYGRANMADLGYTDNGAWSYGQGPFPDVPTPPLTPGIVVGYTYDRAWYLGSGNQGGWQAISELQMQRNPVAQADATDGITSLRVVYAQYAVAGYSFLGVFRVFGDTVFTIGYKRAGDTRYTYPRFPLGSYAIGGGSGLTDVQAYELAAPEGHLLSNMFVPSFASSVVPSLQSFFGGGMTISHPPAIGSMMFSFRLKDPTLVPPVKMIAQLYVTSATPLTAREVAEAGSAWHRALGSELSDAEVDAMTLEIEDLIVSDRLDEQRRANQDTPPISSCAV